MKKIAALLMTALILLSAVGCSNGSDSNDSDAPKETTADISVTENGDTEETAAPAIPEATVGGVVFSLNQDGEFFDLLYKYPDNMEYEKNENAEGDIFKYLSDGCDPYAFAIEVTRTDKYTPEEVISGILRVSPTITSAEYNGISWTVGSDLIDESKGILYACSLGDYTYLVQFATKYAGSFDFTELAEVFIRNVTAK